MLEPLHLEKIFEAVSHRWTLASDAEITLEANPGEVSLEKMKAFRSLGVNRLSLGIQSFRDTHLEFLTRIHSGAEAEQALEWAGQAGFENVNGDLIYHLPNLTLEDWEADLQKLIDFGVPHISAYSLTVEAGTPLFTEVNRGRIHLPPDELSVAMMDRTREILQKPGLQAYEISNHAKPGFECRHNLHYWRMEPYLGLGPSAHSFDGDFRWQNTRNLDSYLNSISENNSPVYSTETLTPEMKINERLGFGIRLTEGVDLNRIPEDYRRRVGAQIEIVVKKWSGYLEEFNGRLRLVGQGVHFADAIAVDLFVD